MKKDENNKSNNDYLEGDFQEKVILYLIKNRIWHYVNPAHVTFGLPDIIAIYNGYFIGLELKRPDKKGRASKLQELTLDSINEAGGYGRLISSFDELEELFNEISQT